MENTLPLHFCWTRYGQEAGEGISDILARKEKERSSNNGIFLWGIGNSISHSMKALLKLPGTPKLAFSPIKSSPRIVDVNPGNVVQWKSGETLDGEGYRLPEYSIVTSRSDIQKPKRAHYALVCFSPIMLSFEGNVGEICFGELSNLLSGRQIGPSQVTSVVKRNIGAKCRGTTYPISYIVELHKPYFVKLQDPIPYPGG